MSHSESSDQLCRARREELSAEEQRRLHELVQHSLELRLMSHMLSEFEKESRVRPGDDVLLARINARALGVSDKAPVRRRGLSVVLLAAALLLGASLAAAGIESARQRQTTGTWKSPFAVSTQEDTKSTRPRSVRTAKPGPGQATPVARQPQGDPGNTQEGPSVEVQLPRPAPSAAVPRRTIVEPKALTSSSASELFTRANWLRRQGRSAEAAGAYQLLLELYPNSREVGPTRLALAKYLQATQPERALAQYRAVAASSEALRAEALWGISEVATTLGQRSLAAQALGDLIREFPDSPYAEVARARALHGSP